jgi:hypothetical protein
MQEGIQIATEGGAIALPPKTKITYEQNAPFFDRENLRGSFTNTFKIQGTKENLLLLKLPHLLESSNDEQSNIKSSLIADGIRIEDGLLLVNETKGNLNTRKVELSSIFTGALAPYADLVENKSIKDLELFGVIAIAGDNITDITNATTDNIRSKNTTDWATDIVLNGHDYLCFPTCHIEDEHYEFVNIWDAVNNEIQVFQINPMPSGAGNRVNPISTILPMIYYHQVLRHCFSEFGYILKGDLLDNAYFKKHVIANNFSPMKQRRLTLLNLDTGMPENDQYTELDTEIVPGNHLPDITIKEFVNDFMIKFGAAFDIKGNEVYIKQLNGKPVLKGNQKQTPNYIKLKADSKLVRLFYEYSDEEKENYPTEIIADFEQGKDVELSPKLRPVWQGEFRLGPALAQIYCADLKVGVNKFAIENYGKFEFPPFSSLPVEATFFIDINGTAEDIPNPLLMGVYHHLQNNVSSQVFPYMSHDNRLHNISNDVIGDWSLEWQNEDDYGLVDIFLKNWLRIMNSNSKRLFYFNDSYLEYLENDWETFKIIGNQEYYIAKKRAQLPLRKEVEYECYKV